MAKKKPVRAPKTGARRGGRKPGAWTLISPEALRGWREQHKLSRATVATTLGVSSTSVQNWETGHAVATTKMQQRLADLMKAPPSGTMPRRGTAGTPRTNGATPRALGEGEPTVIQATASIVVEALRTGGKRTVSAKELGVLVRTVRDALA